MNGPAEIRVAGHGSEMFCADTCAVDGQWLHAEGRWRMRVGANHTELRWSEPRSYSWRAAEVIEVRWKTPA